MRCATSAAILAAADGTGNLIFAFGLRCDSLRPRWFTKSVIHPVDSGAGAGRPPELAPNALPCQSITGVGAIGVAAVSVVGFALSSKRVPVESTSLIVVKPC